MTMGVVMKLLAGLVGALALASTAQAATFDAFDSFDGTQGAGNFSYLRMPAGPGDPAVLLTAPSGNCVVTSDYCLQDGGALPGVYKALTAHAEGTYFVPDDQLLVHPGASNPIGIFFTAPQDGVYDYTVVFNVLDSYPSGVALVGVTNAGGVVGATPLGGLNANVLTLTRTGSVSLTQGQFFGLIVNAAGSYSNDSTGVNFTLTTGGVPEPAAWALMVLGFGGAGAILRRMRPGPGRPSLAV